MLITKFFFNSCLSYDKFRTCKQEVDMVMMQWGQSTKLHRFILKMKLGKCYEISTPKTLSRTVLFPFNFHCNLPIFRKKDGYCSPHTILRKNIFFFWKNCLHENRKNLTHVPIYVFVLNCWRIIYIQVFFTSLFPNTSNILPMSKYTCTNI